MRRWLVVLAVAAVAVGCGRNPMAVPARDAASSRPPRDAGPAPDRDAAGGPDATEAAGPLPDQAADARTPAADACVPLTCRDPGCFPAYCGAIGDGCGANLDCGDCAAGWSCRNGQCFLDDCRPITCDNVTPFPYCGRVGNGCGGTLDCACPAHAPTCVGNVCNGVGAGCRPLACANAWGDEYCGGLLGDGCGGVLDCARDCSRSGFVCRYNQCVDTRDAAPSPDAVPPRLAPWPPPPPPPPAPPPPPPCPPPPPPLPPKR